jgi:hypothetical protein
MKNLFASRRDLFKFIGLSSAVVYGQTLPTWTAPFQHAGRWLALQANYLIHPFASRYGNSEHIFVSTVVLSPDRRTVKKIYRVDGMTSVGGKPHAKYNNPVAMQKLFSNEVHLLSRLSAKYPQFFVQPSKIDTTERSFEMPYLGADLAALSAAGAPLTAQECDLVHEIKNILVSERIDTMLKLGNLFRANGSIYLGGLNFASEGTGKIYIAPKLKRALEVFA